MLLQDFVVAKLWRDEAAEWGQRRNAVEVRLRLLRRQPLEELLARVQASLALQLLELMMIVMKMIGMEVRTHPQPATR